MVTVDFWREARKAVAQVKEDFVWLAESVHAEFVKALRQEGVDAASDSQLYEAFDLTYDYDIWTAYERYVRGEIPLDWYLERLSLQDMIYPDNYVKLRNLENHDQPRFASVMPQGASLRHWLTFSLMQRGTSLIYNGQEIGASHLPNLFDRDPIDWQGGQEDLSDCLSRLIDIKKSALPVQGAYDLSGDSDLDLVQIAYKRPGSQDLALLAAVSLKGKSGDLAVALPDGDYVNALTSSPVTVKEGKLTVDQDPSVIIL